MPTTHHSEAALECRRRKYAFVRAFPGRLPGWSEAVGRTVAGSVTVGECTLAHFTDGGFLISSHRDPGQDDLLALLIAARDALSPHHEDAFRTLDRLITEEREAMRLARMEKVLGAVETNLPQIPELRSELARLLASL